MELVIVILLLISVISYITMFALSRKNIIHEFSITYGVLEFLYQYSGLAAVLMIILSNRRS